MKRIIEGRTYDTNTSTPIASYEYTNEKSYEVEATIYQTRGGAFFIVHRWGVPNPDWKGILDTKVQFESISRAELDRLVATADQLEIINADAISAPPEAAEESEPGATLYVRLPASLKKQIDDAAKAAKVSANVWAMRCLESCLSGAANR